MSFDLEKGAGASNASVQQPTAARISNFPPTYEQHVNDNMRNFDSEFQEVKLREFDGIQDPKPSQRKRKCPTWVWLLTGISILLIIAALLGGLIIHYMNKQNSHDNKVTSQTPLATRAEQTTTISPTTMTVYITETPPAPSTQVVMTTIIPSTSTPSIATVFSTTTASSSESTSSSSTSSSTTSSSTSTTSILTTSTINPSEAALRSSIAAENSRISDKLIPSPIPTTEISTTTATEVSISTPPPEPSKTLIPMPGGEIGRCGVPGQSCNGKREIEVRDREEFYIGVCGLPGQSCN